MSLSKDMAKIKNIMDGSQNVTDLGMFWRPPHRMAG